MNLRALGGCMLAALASLSGSVCADDRSEYHRRAAAQDSALFELLDRNRDGAVSRDEAAGDLNLGPRFDDVDINRDGLMTREELNSYVERRYGVRADSIERPRAR